MRRFRAALTAAVDAFCAGAGLSLLRWLYLHHTAFGDGPRAYRWLTIIVVVAVWGLSLWVGGASPRWSGLRQDALDAALVAGFGGMVLAFSIFALKLAEVSRFTIGAGVLVGFALMILARAALRAYLLWARRRETNRLHVLFVGDGASHGEFVERLRRHPESGIVLSASLVVDGAEDGEVVRRVEAALHDGVVDEVVIGLPVTMHEAIERVILCATREGKQVRLLLRGFLSELRRYRVAEWYGQAVLSVGEADELNWQLRVKRLIDVVVSAVLLVALSPLFLAIAVAIKVDSPDGPVLFRQERVGRNGRRFRCLKFRSMVPDAEAVAAELLEKYGSELPVLKLRDDPRVTRVGRWLRRTSLDELPQLWNVLRGDMSLVGPRPLAESEVNILDPHIRKRLSMWPGLTCLWQVSGRSDVAWQRRMALDLEYVERWSLWLDLSILARTIPAVLTGKGAY